MTIVRQSWFPGVNKGVPPYPIYEGEFLRLR